MDAIQEQNVGALCPVLTEREKEKLHEVKEWADRASVDF